MAQTDNPAGRLLKILREVKGKADQRLTIKVWAQVFELPEDQHIEVTQRLVLLNNLVDEVESLIRQNPQLNHDLCGGTGF